MQDTSLASPLLANERTFLAWTRTALALVGAGLAAAKFFSGVQGVRIAMACFALAVIFMTIATYRYFHVIHLLTHGQFEVDQWGPIVVTIFLGLAIIAAFCFTWRGDGRRRAQEQRALGWPAARGAPFVQQQQQGLQ